MRRGNQALDDYARRLSAALVAVRDAEHLSGAARAHALAIARYLLPALVVVRLDGVRVEADLRAIRAGLAARSLAGAAARLSALRDALDAPAARLTPPDRRRLDTLDGILAGPPFMTLPTLWSTIGDFVRRLVANSPLGTVVDALGRLLGAVLGSASDPLAIALAIAAGLIAAAALVFVANRTFGIFVPQTTVLEEAGASVVRIDADGARTRATALATAGDYREAARFLFLSTLFALDEAGRLRVDRTMGNRDVLRQARAVPRLAEALAPVVHGFELFWFGHVPVTHEDYERYRRLNERVLEVVR